jgi:hypothetical protein
MCSTILLNMFNLAKIIAYLLNDFAQYVELDKKSLRSLTFRAWLVRYNDWFRWFAISKFRPFFLTPGLECLEWFDISIAPGDLLLACSKLFLQSQFHVSIGLVKMKNK